MKINRSLLIALLGAVLFTSTQAQTEADVASLLVKAQHGNSIAQYNLGRAYASGQGVAADPIEAYVWLSLAYEGGFHGKALGNVTGKLDPAQLEIARQRLVERRAGLNARPAPALPPKTEAPGADAAIPLVRSDPTSQTAPATATPSPSPALSQELAAAIADKKELSSELSQSWNETEALKKQLAEVQTAADFLTAETSKLHAERDALTAKQAELANESTILRSERDHARTLGEQAEAALAQANEQKTALETSLHTTRETAATDKKWLSDELAKAFQESTELKARLAETARTSAATPAAPAYPDLSGKVHELEAALAAVSAEAKSAKQEAIRLADERTDREKQFATLQQQAATLTNANTVLQQEAEGLRRAAAAPVTPGYPDLRPQIATLESQLAAVKTEAGQVREQMAALTQAKDAAEKSLTQKPAAPAYPDLSGKVHEIEASLAAVITEAKSAKQEAARLSDERIDREKQFAALQQQLANLQQQTATLATEHTALQQEAEALRHAAAAPTAPAYPDLRAQVTTLESQLAAQKTEAEQSHVQMTALAQAKEAAEKSSAQSPAVPAYPDLSGKVRELEASLAAQTEALEKSRAALQAQPAAMPPTAAPAYPDLSGKVQELDAALTARAAEVVALGKAADELRQGKTDTDQKLAAAEQSRTELTQQFEEFKRSALANQREHLNRQNQVQMLEAEKTALRQQSAADQTRLADLSSELTAARRQLAQTYPTTPSYPDQRARVEQLETELTKTNEQANSMVTLLNRSQQEAKAANDLTEQLRATIRELETKVSAAQKTGSAPNAAPAYPDLREQVSNLEIQLEAARQLPKHSIPEAEVAAIKQELADTQEKLATALHGYSLMEKERDTLANRPAPTVAPDQSSRVAELEAQLAAKSSPPAYPDLREQVSNLENQLEAARAQPKQAITDAEVAALKQELADTQGKLSSALHDYAEMQKERDALAQRPAPPAMADQSSRVSELEAQLAAKSAPPAYPDLREQVSNLEIQLEAARQLPKHSIPEAEVANLKQELVDTKIKLATTLHGYSLIEKERDELAAKNDRPAANQPDVAQLTEAYNALQRSAAQNERDLAAARALLQQVQGANVLLAQQNSQLKGTLATGAPRIVPTPTAQPPTSVVAAAPPPPATGRMHTVVAGDTLAKISQRYYGTVSNWQPIYNANKELLGLNGSLKVGTELRIP